MLIDFTKNLRAYISGFLLGKEKKKKKQIGEKYGVQNYKPEL